MEPDLLETLHARWDLSLDTVWAVRQLPLVQWLVHLQQHERVPVQEQLPLRWTRQTELRSDETLVERVTPSPVWSAGLEPSWTVPPEEEPEVQEHPLP